MITISSDKVSAKILEKGAELQSVQHNGVEYMWQAQPLWPKHSPVLFPIVGELKHGKYIFEGKEYTLSRHGFARDKVFKASQTSINSVLFTLTSDRSTLEVYPFEFVFKIEYRVSHTTLTCTYIVENVDDKMMYFSVGGHPAFNVPLQGHLSYFDYSLRFNNDDVLNRHLLHNGLIANDTEALQLKNNELKLHPSLFYTDAIVLKDLRSKQVELLTSKDRHGLKFSFEGFPYLGIWASKDAPFVCLEPWCGIADNVSHDQKLIHKEGINQIGAGERWQRTWSVELY